MSKRPLVLVLFGLAAVASSRHAEATFHLWKIDQVFSDATGSVQYVDFVLPFTFDDESMLTGHQLTAGLNSNTLTFGNNLPQVPVAGQHFLVATPGFADVAGITPDYTFPDVPFFNRNGDTLNFAFVDSFMFPALPLDGLHALNRDGTVVENAPINFAGQSGFVPLPDNPDTNGDGFVDISDIQIIAGVYLTSGPSGDANHDGLVDVSDIQVIAAHWLQTWPPGGSGTTVPEPATCALLIVGFAPIALAGLYRRRRAKSRRL